MRATRSEVGAWGEDIAAKYLREHGFTIRERNWRHGHGELDIVAERDSVIIIVEVRTRRSDAYGTPEESVRAAKRAKLIVTAQAYLDARGFIGNALRTAFGRHVMVGNGQRCVRAAHFAAGSAQAFKCLRAGYFMDQVTVDV